MKNKRIVILLITVVILIICFVAIGNLVVFDLIFCPAPLDYENGDVYHPGLLNDSVITEVKSVQSYLNDVDPSTGYQKQTWWDPPVASRNLDVICDINEEDADKALGMKLYLFKHERDHLLNINDAILVVNGNLHATQGYISFFSDFPEDMEAGKYIFVVIDSDNRIDSVFEYEIVDRDSQSDPFWVCAYKPVIYLYPEETTDCYVSLDLEGTLTCTYPAYNEDYGWHITADPDGTLTDDATGRRYDYLFWEGEIEAPDIYDNAICVRGCDTAGFLEDYLEACGLNYSEIDDFISYWLPRMESNEYNLIAFPTEGYEEEVTLNVSPEPDNVILVYMLFTPLNEEVEISEEQQLIWPEGTDRTGFTVVEWGGSEL